MRYSDKLAFAQGYHVGISGMGFEQQYDQHDLKTQFIQGYEAGRAKFMNDLEDKLARLEAV